MTVEIPVLLDPVDPLRRHLGKIAVSYELARMQPSMLKQLFTTIGFIPVEMDNRVMDGVIMYTGYSTLFDAVTEGSIVPEYDITAHTFDSDIVGADIRMSTYQDTPPPKRRIRIR